MSKIIKELLIVAGILLTVFSGIMYLYNKEDDEILKKIDSMKADKVQIEISDPGTEAYLNDLTSEEKEKFIGILHSISKKEIKRVQKVKVMYSPTEDFRVKVKFDNKRYLFCYGYYDSENVVLRHEDTEWKIYNEELGNYLIEKKKEIVSKKSD